MLIRRIARPMLAASFVVDGVDVLRHPGPHADLARAALAPALDRIPVTSRLASLRTPSTRQLVTAVQLHGAAVAGAGILLALGKAPRVAALALAALTLPSALAQLPGGDRAAADVTTRTERRRRLVQQTSLIGGALLAGIDTEGRPGLHWRISQRCSSGHESGAAARHVAERQEQRNR